jgi:hypothetical protein
LKLSKLEIIVELEKRFSGITEWPKCILPLWNAETLDEGRDLLKNRFSTSLPFCISDVFVKLWTVQVFSNGCCWIWKMFTGIESSYFNTIFIWMSRICQTRRSYVNVC